MRKLALALALASVLAWTGAHVEAGEGVRLPGAPAPDLAKLFTPRHAPAGAYQVTVLENGIEGAARTVEAAVLPGVRPGEPEGAWQVQALDPLEAFGTAGTYDRAKVAQLYAGRRVSVVRGPVERNLVAVAAVTLISPYPDATLSRLEPGTLAILLYLDKAQVQPLVPRP